MYICSVIQRGTIIHQQSTEELGQINKWIKVFKTTKLRLIGEAIGYNQMELENDDGTRIMLVTWNPYE